MQTTKNQHSGMERNTGLRFYIATAILAAVFSAMMSSTAADLRPINPAEYAPIRHPFIVAWFYPRGAPSESDTYESDYLNILTSNYGSFNAWAEIGVLPLQQIGWRHARLDRLKTRAEAGQAV